MSNQPIGIGIVGAGFSANQHMSGYRRLGGRVRLVGVASRSLPRAEAFARDNGFEFATTHLDELLARPDVHLIDVVTPNFAHEEVLLAAARAGKHVACEKPLTGFFGDATDAALMREQALESVQRIREAVQRAGVQFFYAENWIYAPPLQKAVRLAEASGGTLFDIRAEESHSGSHSPYSREWKTTGGGALLRTGSHPLGAALHIKRREGERLRGRPTRVSAVTCEVANVTRMEQFVAEEKHWVGTGWKDVEDWATLLLTFNDGSRATIATSDIVLGGIRNRLELYLSNCCINANMNPNNTCTAYAPAPDVFASEHISEKLDTKAGWSFPSIDEEWFQGYPQEIEDFVECAATGRAPLSGIAVAADVVEVTYAAYQAAAEGRRLSL